MNRSVVMAKTAGNGIDRKNQIEYIDNDEHEQERGEHQSTIDPHGELTAMKVLASAAMTFGTTASKSYSRNSGGSAFVQNIRAAVTTRNNPKI